MHIQHLPETWEKSYWRLEKLSLVFERLDPAAQNNQLENVVIANALQREADRRRASPYSL